jgi:hypothetical protein
VTLSGSLSAGSSGDGPSELAGVTPTGSSRSPTDGAQPVLVLDPVSLATGNLLAAAQEVGRKWRFDFLNELAVKATDEVIGLEKHVLALMDLGLTKFTHAQQLLNPVLLETIKELKETIRSIGIDLGASPDLDAAVKEVGESASTALLLQRIITFLTETQPSAFWIGLFDALIKDIAAADPHDPFPMTKQYLEVALDPATGALKDAAALIDDLAKRLDHEVDELVKPLSEAVGRVIAGLNQATGEVATSLDGPELVYRRGTLAGQPDVPGVNPLAEHAPKTDPLDLVKAQLSNAVENLAREIKTRMLDVLTSGAPRIALFRELMIAYLVLPILAFLVIAVAGGPFAAAALAAVILFGLQELVAIWLSGPLRKEIDKAKERVTAAVRGLQQSFAREAAVVETASGADYLHVLAQEFAALRELAPEQFFQAVARLVQGAHAELLENAVQLALAAEQALGIENCTAFSAISYDYRSSLEGDELAPLLPGGADPSVFSGVALRRDLGRLQQQRTALLNDKEFEIVQRISLLQLVGGDAAQFAGFLQSGTMLLELKEEELLDRRFPGVYRALIKEIKVFGLFDPPATLPTDATTALRWSQSVPVILKHLGPSRTRVKRSANAAAPPLALPDCLRPREECLERLLGRLSPASGQSLFPGVPGLLGDALQLWQDLNRRDDAVPTPGGREAAEAWVKFVPNALAQAVGDITCGVVSPETVRATASDVLKRVLEQIVLTEETLARNRLPVEEAVEDQTEVDIKDLENLDFPEALDVPYPRGMNRVPVMQAKLSVRSRKDAVQRQKDRLPPAPSRPLEKPAVSLEDALAWALDGLGAKGSDGNPPAPGLRPVFREAYDRAVASLRRRIGKWGDTVLELDKRIIDWADTPDKPGKAGKLDVLGFVTLRRDMPEEVAVFNLFPSNEPSGPLLATQPSLADGGPFRQSSALQYRPFENRALEGQLLVHLPDPPPVGPVATPQLRDIVLEIAFRACYDSDLAACVSAEREQTARGINLAAQFGGVVLPPRKARVDVGASELRTVQFSLRTHRDRTLGVWMAAVQAWNATHPLGPPPPSPLAEAVNFRPLGRDEPLTALPGGGTRSIFHFLSERSLSMPSLQELPTRIPVVRADLDFLPIAPALGGSVVHDPRLVALGIAVVPTMAGARNSDVDALRMRLQIDEPLSPLLPGFSLASPLTRRLAMTPTAAAGVKLGEVWPREPKVTLDLQHAIANKLLYDVLVSVTFSIPALCPSSD